MHMNPPPPHPVPFERLVRLHGPAVLRFCAARVGSGDAEDCFQTTMLAALRGLDGLREERAARAWLFTIAARACTDALRARRRAPIPTAEIEALADAAPDGYRDRAIWARVGALAPKQREAVALRYLGDLSHAEIGRAMGISEAAARRNVHDALARLREEL